MSYILYSRARSTDSPESWAAYHKFRNKTLHYLRNVKNMFFQSLSNSPNPRSFLCTLKKLRIYSTLPSIPAFHHNDITASTNSKWFSLCQISGSIRCSSRINTQPSFLYSIIIDGLSSLPISQSAILTLYADSILLFQPLVSPFCMFSVQSNYKSHLLLAVLSLSFC